MRLGLAFASSGLATQARDAIQVARHAEQAGFDSLWAVEHVVVPGDYGSKYPYSPSGRMAGGEDVPIVDPVVWLTWVGAHTETILLATGMMILPQRNPVVTAKAVASLDHLTGGRVRLGVGVGWLREEFDALGVPFEERGARADEYIAVMRTLWGEARPSFHGRFFSFHDARLWPKPASGRVPIIIGGHSEAAARRAGRLGDGFFPAPPTLDEVEHLVQLMRQTAEDAGRDPGTVEVTVGAKPTPESLERLVNLGVARVTTAAFGADLDTVKGRLDKAAAAVRDAVGLES
ncbi:MAG: LLM class F420-dependent oxidoreductase [Candidatus Dormibacteria bacterium]